MRGVHPAGPRVVGERVVAPQLRRLLERVVVPEAEQVVGAELDAVVVPDPGGMREDVAHGDREFPLGIPGHVRLERGVEVHPSLLHQLHEADDGQHLRHRSHVVHRPASGGHAVVEFGDAHALREDDLPIHRDRDRQTRQVVVVPDLLHVVEQPLVRPALAGQGRCIKQQDNGQCDGSHRPGDSHCLSLCLSHFLFLFHFSSPRGRPRRGRRRPLLP